MKHAIFLSTQLRPDSMSHAGGLRDVFGCLPVRVVLHCRRQITLSLRRLPWWTTQSLLLPARNAAPRSTKPLPGSPSQANPALAAACSARPKDSGGRLQQQRSRSEIVLNARHTVPVEKIVEHCTSSSTTNMQVPPCFQQKKKARNLLFRACKGSD